MSTTSSLLPSIEILTSDKAVSHSVIWLHGLGADGSDFVPIVPELQLPESIAARFIFPHAPLRPVTINNGYQMRAWYDITAISLAGITDKAGIAQSVKAVSDLIAHENARGVPTNNIVLAGFSQGAALTLATGLHCPERLGGLIALSGYLPDAQETINAADNVNKETSIFLAHGTDDNVVPYVLGKAAYVTLQQLGYSVEWHSYPMQHTVCQAEVRDISHWLQKIFKG